MLLLLETAWHSRTYLLLRQRNTIGFYRDRFHNESDGDKIKIVIVSERDREANLYFSIR